ANGAGWVRRVRWTDGQLPGASVLLRGAAGCTQILLHIRGERGDDDGHARCSVAVQERGTHGALIGLFWATVPVGGWTDLTVPLARAAVADEHLTVTVAVLPGHEVAVQRVALGGAATQ